MTKEEMRARFAAEHPNHVSLRLNKTEKYLLEAAERKRQKTERRLRLYALVAKLREVDGKTLREIADEVGLTYTRISQILAKITEK